MSRPSRPRVLVLTQFHRPEPNFITGDVADMLARRFDVTVVTAHPNYPEGRFYDGHRWWLPRGCIEDDVVVWRLPMFPYHGRSPALRLVSYLSFAAAAAAFAPFVVPRPSVIWVYHGPFTVGLAAIWFRLATRARVIFTCADLWPECFTAAGVMKPGLLMRWLFAYRRAVNRVAHVLICATRGTRDRYLEEGVAATALPVVPVWVEGSGNTAVPAMTDSGPFHIVYAGNLGPAQSLETVVQAAAVVERERLPVQFDVYGTGSAERDLRALASQLGVGNIRFHGRVPPGEAFEVSARAFAQIVSLRPSPLFAMTVPSKVSFCCSAAAPVLYGLEGEAKSIMDETGGGIPFDSGDPATLVAALKRLLSMSQAEHQQMRESLRAYYRRNLAKEKLLACYEDIFIGQLQTARVGEVSGSPSSDAET